MEEEQVILVLLWMVDQVKEVMIVSHCINQFNWSIKTLVPGVVDILETSKEEIKWSPPSQPNGIITGYQVIYSIYQIPSTKMMSEVLDNTITEFSIDHLSEYI